MGDRTTAFYNPFTQKWAISLRQGSKADGRSRGYLENEDPEMAVSVAHSLAKGIKDKNIVLWFTPSDKELPHPEFLMCVQPFIILMLCLMKVLC